MQLQVERSFVVLVLGGLLTLVSCGQTKITSSSTSPSQQIEPSVVNQTKSELGLRGGVVDNTEFSNVVNVSSIANLICSGLVISPRHVVTAASCAGPARAPSKTIVGISKGQAKSNYPSRIAIHPDYNFKSSTTNVDIALLEFSAPFPVKFPQAKLINISQFLKINVNSSLTAVGHGVINSNIKTAGVRRTGSFTYIGLASVSGSRTLDGSEVIVTKPGTANQAACYGDAGGPIFSAGQPSLAIGILASTGLSPGIGGCEAQTNNYYVSFANSRVRAWLNSELAKLNYVIRSDGLVGTR